MIQEPFAVAALPGGGVFLEWRGERADIEVHIGSEGGLSYLVEDRRAGEARYEERDSDTLGAILDRLVDVLRA